MFDFDDETKRVIMVAIATPIIGLIVLVAIIGIWIGIRLPR